MASLMPPDHLSTRQISRVGIMEQRLVLPPPSYSHVLQSFAEADHALAADNLSAKRAYQVLSSSIKSSLTWLIEIQQHGISPLVSLQC